MVQRFRRARPKADRIEYALGLRNLLKYRWKTVACKKKRTGIGTHPQPTHPSLFKGFSPLCQEVWTQQERIARQIVSGRYLYTAVDPTVQRRQLLARRTVEFLPTVVDASVLDVSPEEVKAAILLFYSLLDEQQRRLYAGVESLKLGRGGDRQLANFLDLDPHTMARGRQQLLTQDVEVDRARKAGGGRKRVEKKRPK